MSHYNVDYIPYPTKGYAAEIYAGKKGFSKNFNTWYFTGKAFGSWHLSPKIFLSSQIYAHIKLPFRQPFINRQFLGYNDAFIQGYEYFVIDGVAGGFLKTTITREISNFKIRVPPVKKGNEPFYIPFRFFAKVYGNTGYVHNPQPGNNQLSNRQLYTGGFGIDILTFYDISFKLDWSFNQLGQNGLFLHRNSIF